MVLVPGTSSPARLDHAGAFTILPSQQQVSVWDPQQEMASSNHESGSHPACVALPWPSAQPGTSWQKLVLPIGAPLVPSQDASAEQ